MSEIRMARDGIAYRESEFMWWYGSVQGQLMWDEAGELDYPGTPSDAMDVSDHEEPSSSPVQLPIVCVAMSGSELPLICNEQSSINWIHARVSEWLNVHRRQVVLYRNVCGFVRLYPRDKLENEFGDTRRAIDTLVPGEYINVVVVQPSSS